MEYFFTLTFSLRRTDTNLDEIVERLGSAGCTDSLVGTGTPGLIALEFSREAKSAREAMASAMTDVMHAIPMAELIEASPDFLGISPARAAS
ncbi:hypothetical protein Q4S45_21700 [Massilia sp. R2A-15]|uniref:hypothetical protein n=1 Tax=Massilia sp. R2A-15 TaxID=3064278 RepID=UPI0027353B5D|nr:hypothetical protein [Massilia sp. R2A-15]WLI89277.1 hypothetical protein Q4S45_21700 [Massilia sp. R2A-15]